EAVAGLRQAEAVRGQVRELPVEGLVDLPGGEESLAGLLQGGRFGGQGQARQHGQRPPRGGGQGPPRGGPGAQGAPGRGRGVGAGGLAWVDGTPAPVCGGGGRGGGGTRPRGGFRPPARPTGAGRGGAGPGGGGGGPSGGGPARGPGCPSRPPVPPGRPAAGG